MLGRFAKLLLVLTSIAPIAIVYAWVAFVGGKLQLAISLVAACLALLILCGWLIRYTMRNIERFPFKPTEIEAADRENVAFLLLYLSPLFTSELSNINYAVVAPTIIIFALLTATGNSYHFNPLLGLAGWHFYKVKSAEGVVYVLITRKQLINTTAISEAGQLTDYILLDVEK